MDSKGPGAFSHEDLVALFEISQDLLCVVDLTGHLLQLSDSWTTALGWQTEQMIGHHFTDYLHPEDHATTLQRVAAVVRGEQQGPAIENRYRHADGSYRWLRWHTRVNPRESTVLCVAHDVTQQRSRTTQQEIVADLGRQALEGLSIDTLLLAAAEGLSRGLALPMVAVLELLPDDQLVVRASAGLPSLPPQAVVSAEHSPVSAPALASRRAVWREDVQADPDVHPLHRRLGSRAIVLAPVGRADRPWGVLTGADRRPRVFDTADIQFVEQLAHVVGAAIERLGAEQRLLHEATHDSLTGLPNRDLLRERMQQALRAAVPTHQAVGLLLCDLDGFKDVNDSLGHAAGDAVLLQLAQRLLDVVGPSSIVARLGGDEFAICVVGPTTELEVLGLADAVVQAMHRPFVLPELEVPLSTSIGIAVSPTHGTDASTLLRHADIAMYRAKAENLGSAVYDAHLDSATTDRLVLTADLRAAIATGSLDLHYQPVVDLHDGTVRSVEALCRWEHPERGPITPSTFVNLAEHTGVVLSLTRWVVRTAVAQAERWRRAGHALPCAINLSMAAVTDDLASAALLDELIGAASLLTVEITESWLVDRRGREVIAKLAAGGVRLSLDDFGTGFSSLAALQSFPVRQLKLDRQFVLGFDDERGQDVLTAVTQLGRALGMDVIAEGVEHSRTAERLREAGIRLGQGFLWAPAMPAATFDSWLAARSSPV